MLKITAASDMVSNHSVVTIAVMGAVMRSLIGVSVARSSASIGALHEGVQHRRAAPNLPWLLLI